MAPRLFCVLALLAALVLPVHGLSASAECADSDNADRATAAEMACCAQIAADASSSESHQSTHSHCQTPMGCCTAAIARGELVTALRRSVCAPSPNLAALSDGFHPETLERPPLAG